MKYLLYLLVILGLENCEMKKETKVIDTDCTGQLEIISELNLAEFKGLNQECTITDARKAFDIDEGDEASSHKMGGVFMKRLSSRKSRVQIWLEDEKIYCVQINEPELKNLQEVLGLEDEVIESRLGSATDQYVYYEKGIAAHISAYDQNIKRLYFFHPMEKEAFVKTPIANVAIVRRRR